MKSTFHKISLCVIFIGVFWLQPKTHVRPTWQERNLAETLVDTSVYLRPFRLNAADQSNPANRARALYYYVAGPPTEGYPDGFSGPPRGLFGLFDDVIGDSSVNRAFLKIAVRNCSSIPTSGTLDVPGHQFGDLVFNFSPGKQVVPAHFQDLASTTYEKRIRVDRNDFPLLTIEMSCPDGNSSVTGYMVMESGLRVELYFQFDETTGRRQLDTYMDYPQASGNDFDEKMSVRFESDDGNEYDLYAVRTTNDSTEGSFGVALRGNRSTNQAQIALVQDTDATPDDATPVHSASPVCVNLSSDESASGCDAIRVPASTVQGGGFTIDETEAIEVDTIELLQIEPEVHDFGTLALGESSTATLQITNIGTVAATGVSSANVSAPFSYLGGAFPGTGGTCGSTLAASSSCSVVVSYTPTAAGEDAFSIDLSYTLNSLSYISRIGLRGVAQGQGTTGPAVLTISEAEPFDFGTRSIGTSFSHLFTVSNTGGDTATNLAVSAIVAPFAFTGGAYPGAGGTCGTSLAAGATCLLEIAFSPTASGVFTDNFDLTYSDGSNNQTLSKSLTGTGAAIAQIVISDGPTYDYGSLNVGGTTSHIFTLTNAGSVAATAINVPSLNTPFQFTGGSYPGSSGDCGTSLAAAATCQIEIAVSPVTAGAFSEPLNVSYNDGSATASATIQLQATGVTPALITISETDPFDFGSIATGSSSTHTFTLTNAGGSAAVAMAEVGLSTPFGFLGGSFPGTGGDCGASLAAGATCNIVISFSPVVTGVSNDSIDISYNDGSTAQSSTRDVTGVGVNSAVLAISDGTVYDFGSH
ncbi:MAG: choice-of-anchor D domain-containing protein, partial [Pseudomonadota bacterium]